MQGSVSAGWAAVGQKWTAFRALGMGAAGWCWGGLLHKGSCEHLLCTSRDQRPQAGVVVVGRWEGSPLRRLWYSSDGESVGGDAGRQAGCR